jgi:hypothetical protein
MNLTLGEPVFLRNLRVFPIHDDIPPSENGSYASIEDALRSHKAAFRELETPDINTIAFENNFDKPVVMIDGEEITGAFQNRIIAASSLVESRTSQELAVVCAEEGRWNELGGFRSGQCSYPGLRSILLQSRRKKKDVQQHVWNEIERKLTVTRTRSTTSSMHDIYVSLDDEVTRYLEGFTGLDDGSVGFIGCAGDRILGCDIFHHPLLYRTFETKLLRSYALDALEYRRTASRPPDVARFLDTINQALDAKAARRQHTHITTKTMRGQLLTHNKRSVHLSAFPVR